jgi:hypothetical protein
MEGGSVEEGVMRVLLVDDSPVDRKVVQLVLGSNTFAGSFHGQSAGSSFIHSLFLSFMAASCSVNFARASALLCLLVLFHGSQKKRKENRCLASIFSIACLPCFSSYFSLLVVPVGFLTIELSSYRNLNNHLVFFQLPPSTAPRRPWSSSA